MKNTTITATITHDGTLHPEIKAALQEISALAIIPNVSVEIRNTVDVHAGPRCSDCETPISTRNDSGLCRSCVQKHRNLEIKNGIPPATNDQAEQAATDHEAQIARPESFPQKVCTTDGCEELLAASNKTGFCRSCAIARGHQRNKNAPSKQCEACGEDLPKTNKSGFCIKCRMKNAPRCSGCGSVLKTEGEACRRCESKKSRTVAPTSGGTCSGCGKRGQCRSCAVAINRQKTRRAIAAQKKQYCETHQKEQPCILCEQAASPEGSCAAPGCSNARSNRATGLCKPCDRQAAQAPRIVLGEEHNEYECRRDGCYNLRYIEDETGYCEDCKASTDEEVQMEILDNRIAG